MIRISPFVALRPRADLAERVASVPYDVVTTEEARRLTAGNPHSFLRVTRAELELADDVSPYADAVYERAAQNFRRLQQDGIFVRDGAAEVFLYRQEMSVLGRRVSQTGVLCTCHIDDYSSGVIRTHENTRRVKEDDRTRHVLALDAHAGPVFLMYRENEGLNALMERDQALPPLADFEAVDGVRHTLWRAERASEYVAGFAEVDVAYVADGHHRAAAAVRAGTMKRGAQAARPKSAHAPYEWFLAALFRTRELTILPYHRTVRDLNGMSHDQLLARLRGVASVAPVAAPVPENPLAFGMYLGRRWYELTLPKRSLNAKDPLGSLHYALLSDHVLGPILGIGDLRTDERIDFVGGIHGHAALEQRVDQGEASVAFAMAATGVEEITRVADARRLMPPKSTWFEPKLRSGLAVHLLG